MPQAKPTGTAARPRNAIVSFVTDTYSEMKKVTWLSRREVVYLTALVLIISVAAGVVLGLIDIGFTELMERFILR